MTHVLKRGPMGFVNPADQLQQPQQVGIGSANHFVAFVDREPARRFLSLHRVNRRKANHDVKAIKEDQPEDTDARGRSVDYSGSGIRS
jgi:hypothetical protein